MITQSLSIFQPLILAVAAILSILVSARFIDRRSIKDYGLMLDRAWWFQLMGGLSIGAVTLSFLFLIEWLAGWITIVGFGWQRVSSIPYGIWLADYLIAMILIGFYEELIYRGYQITNLTEGLQAPNRSSRASAVGVIAISTVIFGLLHAGNSGDSWIFTTGIILAGVVFALPFLFTGQLAFSVGLHISWNFMQGGILGMPVNGKYFRGSFIQIHQTGPKILTGGSFGPESGLIGVVGLLIMLGLVCLYIRKSGLSCTIHPIIQCPYSNSGKTHEQGL